MGQNRQIIAIKYIYIKQKHPINQCHRSQLARLPHSKSLMALGSAHLHDLRCPTARLTRKTTSLHCTLPNIPEHIPSTLDSPIKQIGKSNRILVAKEDSDLK
jgi:hypothetical protein